MRCLFRLGNIDRDQLPSWLSKRSDMCEIGLVARAGYTKSESLFIDV